MDAVIICVPTPLDEHHQPDLSYVTGTVEAIAPHTREGQLIVLESTTYPGTRKRWWRRCLKAATRAASKWRAHGRCRRARGVSPEREDPATTRRPPRHSQVVGGSSASASEMAAALYGTIFHRVVPVSSPRSRR